MTTRYAIKVVPPEWKVSMPLPFDKASHDASGVENGTRVLVYVQGTGIVAEGEVHGFFIEPRRWAQETKDNLPEAFANADYLLPLGVVYKREGTTAITLEAVRDALADPAFPDGETWRPIEREVYERLNNFPD